MPIDLYYIPGSVFCRAVRLTAACLDVDLNLKLVNLHNKEHLQSEFLKLNCQHCLPTIVDDGYCLWESRAIMCYLSNRYGKDDKLYPREPKARGLVDQRLYFDMGTLTRSFADYYNPITIRGLAPDPEAYEKIERAFEIFNNILEGCDYSAGDHLTIADIALAATTSNFHAGDFDLSKYPNVSRWFDRITKELPMYEEINVSGIKAMKKFVEHIERKRASGKST